MGRVQDGSAIPIHVSSSIFDTLSLPSYLVIMGWDRTGVGLGRVETGPLLDL